VLTEDEITKSLETILASSGFDLTKTAILPYYGITAIKHLRPLVNMIRATNSTAKIVLHRDQDFLTDEEVEAWKTDVRALNVEPFITRGRDIESHFLDSKYLAEGNQDLTEAAFETLIAATVKEMQPQIIKDYVNGRIDLARKGPNAGSVNAGTIAVKANSAISADARKYCGKSVLRTIKLKFQVKHGKNLSLSHRSDRLKDAFLSGVAKKTVRITV
jgi:hypothetical protein